MKAIFLLMTFPYAVNASDSCKQLINHPNTRAWVTSDQFGKVYAKNYELLVKTDLRQDSENTECVFVSWTFNQCVIRLFDGGSEFRSVKTREEKRCSYYP
ncbi:MAG: hypothetical protein ACXVCP_04705 [Bdellovibrio sp.]